MLALSAILVFGLSLSSVHAVPVAVEIDTTSRVAAAAPVTLATAQVAAFTPYTYFAAAGYCESSVTKTWTCGRNCNALPGFIPTASGGDGGLTQYWFVGYYPPTDSIVVSYQGTEAEKVVPLLVDADYWLDPLNRTLFTGVSRDVETHGGFGNAHDRSANAVLAAVTKTLTAHPNATVVTVGHSLGAALAQISAVFLKLRLPSGTKVKTIGYSVPRVGNPEWADLVDSLVGDVTHINNKQDVVPIVPGRFLGFAHPSGEIHITSNGKWLSCPGQDSEAKGCTIDSVPDIFNGDTNDHSGPFNGIIARCDG